MKDLIQKHIDNNFSDFKGLSITARVPMKDALVNEAISEALQSMTEAAPKAANTTAQPPVDLRSLLQFVKKAEIHATEGTIVLDVVIDV